MSIKQADLVTAIRNASEGCDRALIDLPLAGASFGEMTIISCTGKLFNDLQAERRRTAALNAQIDAMRAEIDALRAAERREWEQSVTIAALQREIATLNA